MSGTLLWEDKDLTQENMIQVSSMVSNGVRVTIQVKFLPDRSDIANMFFAYAYHITLENLREDAIRLLNRHWLVFSAGKQIADVKGEGVVGEQPVIGPGETFDYESWTFTRDHDGAMKGAFTFVTQELDFFDVEIAEFCLVFLGDMQMH
jgi:ApaG protein